jgi:hypothetical protein
MSASGPLRAFNNLLYKPIVDAEMKYLRQFDAQTNRWLRWARRLLFIVACGFALLPFWLPMREMPRTYILLPLVFFTVYAVHFSVSVRTLILASHTIAHEKATNNWDALVLTGVDARRILYSKCWAVLRCTWRAHVLTVPLKFGLVYGMAWFFATVTMQGCYKGFGSVLCYYNSYYGSGALVMYTASALVLLLYTLAEVSLLAAFGIMGSILAGRSRIGGFTIALVARFALILVGVTIWIMVAYNDVQQWISYPYYAGNQYQYAPYVYPSLESWPLSLLERRAIVEAVVTTTSSLADSGTVLATNNMRFFEGLTEIRLIQQFLTAIFGLSLFAMFTWGALRLAERMAVRQAALRFQESPECVDSVVTPPVK